MTKAAERAKAKTTRHDWSRVDAMTDAERHVAALADPDAQPLTPDDFKRVKRVPQVAVIRRAFRLTQEEFAAQFHIPVEALRDGDQGSKAPDEAAKAYLWVIASEPKMVREACFDGRGRQQAGWNDFSQSGLVVACDNAKVLTRIHPLMQDSDDLDEAGPKRTIEEHMHRLGNRPFAAFLAAVANVEASNARK